MDFLLDYVCQSGAGRKVGALRFFDLFGFAPTPRWMYRRFSSFRSVVFSFIICGLLLGYMVFTLRRWIADAPQTSTTQLYLSKPFPNASISSDDIVIGFQKLSGTGDCGEFCHLTQSTDSFPYINESIFTVQIHSVYVDEMGVYHSERADVEVVQEVPWLGPLGKKMYAAQNPKELIIGGGNYLNYRDYRYVMLEVRLCGDVATLFSPNETTTAAPAAAATTEKKKVRCASFNEVRDTFRNGEFVLGLRQHDAHAGREVITAASYAATPDTTQWYDVAFAIVEDSVQPDFVRSFFTRTTSRLKRILESFFLTSSFSRDEPLDDRVVLVFRLLLDPTKTKIIHHSQSVADLAGSWAALMGALMTLGLFFVSYNRRKFYRRHPEWDGYDSDFKYVGPKWFEKEDATAERDSDDDGNAEGGARVPLVAEVAEEGLELQPQQRALAPRATHHVQFSNVGRNVGRMEPFRDDPEEEEQRNATASRKPNARAAEEEDLEGFLDSLLDDSPQAISPGRQQQHGGSDAAAINALVQQEVARQLARLRREHSAAHAVDI